jgi:hypothetical protein
MRVRVQVRIESGVRRAHQPFDGPPTDLQGRPMLATDENHENQIVLKARTTSLDELGIMSCAKGCKTAMLTMQVWLSMRKLRELR